MEAVAVVDAYVGGRGAVWQRLEDELGFRDQTAQAESWTGSGVATQLSVKLEIQRPLVVEQQLEDERELCGRALRPDWRRRSGVAVKARRLSVGQGLRGLEGRSQRESGVAIETVAAVDVGVVGRAGVGQVKSELGLWG